MHSVPTQDISKMFTNRKIYQLKNNKLYKKKKNQFGSKSFTRKI